MVKQYREIDEVIKDTDVPNSLYKFEELMKEKPNWDKNKYDTSKKVFEDEKFVILKVKSKNKIGFIAYNKSKVWEQGHSHLDSEKMARTIISNVNKKKKPKTKNIYLLRSHARLSNDEKYINFIEKLIQTKMDKGKRIYRNRR